MANYANTKAVVAANVYTNGNNEVTAAMVKAAISDVIDTLIAGGALYGGVARPSDAAVTPDANVFFLAAEPGTYTNKGGLVVNDGEVAVLRYNGTWSKVVTGMAAAADLLQVSNTMGDIFQNVFGEEIDLSAVGFEDKYISNANVWVNGAGTYNDCVLLPVRAGERYMLFVPDSPSHQSIYAFLGSDTAVGVPVDFVPGFTSRVIVDENTELIIPDGCSYLYLFNKTDTATFLPTIAGHNIQFALQQGYFKYSGGSITDDTLNTRVRIGDVSNMIKGRYHIKLKPGYLIRAIFVCKAGGVSAVEEVGPDEKRTEYMFSPLGEREYSAITLCKEDDTQAITPTEDIVEFLTRSEGLYALEQGLYELKGEVDALKDGHPIKNAVFMGDSITQGVYSYWHNGVHNDANRYNGFDISDPTSVAESTEYHGIHYYFAKLAGCEVVNLAKRGAGYVADTRNIGNALDVATSYSFADVDFVALFFGVNDYIQGVTIGAIGTAGTVRGNLASVLQKIASDNPLCKIVVFSPYNTFGQVSKGGDYTSNELYGDEGTNYALGYDYQGKGTLGDYIAAIDDVCAYYGVQHVKLSASNVVNRLTIKDIMIDGLHPSKESYPMLAAEIYGKGNYGV